MVALVTIDKIHHPVRYSGVDEEYSGGRFENVPMQAGTET
jgi:hypothetical protein